MGDSGQTKRETKMDLKQDKMKKAETRLRVGTDIK